MLELMWYVWGMFPVLHGCASFRPVPESTGGITGGVISVLAQIKIPHSFNFHLLLSSGNPAPQMAQGG